jgi:hypothetical protein
MNHNDGIDRILSSQPEIVPSSGFADAVMQAARREASAPPPIPFPWTRALPGLIALGLALVSLIAAGLRANLGNAPVPDAASSAFAALAHVLHATGAGWITLALAASLASMALVTRFRPGKT